MAKETASQPASAVTVAPTVQPAPQPAAKSVAAEKPAEIFRVSWKDQTFDVPKSDLVRDPVEAWAAFNSAHGLCGTFKQCKPDIQLIQG